MATTIILIVHILAAMSIIGLVLLQHGKGADAGAAFGAGAAGGVSGSVFGAQGSSNFLSRSTAILATIFFLTSLSLAYLHQSSSEEPKSIMEQTTVSEEPKVPTTAPDQPSDVPQLPQAPEGSTGTSESTSQGAVPEGGTPMEPSSTEQPPTQQQTMEQAPTEQSNTPQDLPQDLPPQAPPEPAQ
jgi:preprotein translocase subunit SecG